MSQNETKNCEMCKTKPIMYQAKSKDNKNKELCLNCTKEYLENE